MYVKVFLKVHTQINEFIPLINANKMISMTSQNGK